MKKVLPILVFSILFLFIFIWLAVSDSPELVTGTMHPDYKSMLIGGTDVQSTSLGFWQAFLYGSSILGILCSIIYLGANNKKHDGVINKYLITGFVLYFLAFVWLFMSHQSYVDTNHSNFVMGWPTPTAVMIYIMWATPSFIVMTYILGFRRWVLSEADEKKFEQIVARRNQNK